MNKKVEQNDTLKTLEKSKKFLGWIQEFSKKIIFVVFLLYVATMLFSCYLVYISFIEGGYTGIDTLITEVNLTFREVVGGYIIKAAVENAFKIGGNYLTSVIEKKIELESAKFYSEHPELNSDMENIVINEDGEYDA